MRTIRTVDLINDFKAMSEWLEENSREWITIARPRNKNMVLMTETEANELAKVRRNLEYMTKLNESIAQAERGEIISYSREQMRNMENL